MSKTIDQKVVEMRFDNKDFEKNAQASMSTLEKLKKSLNLTGASKGLEQLDSAAKRTNIGVLGESATAVGKKFSAMEVVGITALANITNSAINAGKRMVKALTIDPIKTGFQEYELKMGSIQTIMASTGASLSEVNKYLNELNEYSDKTIYSFSDMTNNIGKFTNAGVKLEDAVLAIKGISNEAAVSGANANEASRAMYNFAQALSAGYVKLIDWKSIELANMATVEFKEQLIQSAVACGTLTKAGDGMYKTLKGNTLNATKNFNDTLTDQWMTTEVLINTLKDYSDETTTIGKKAYASAQDVKTFSMMMDTLKESAQSGWATSWEIVFGDFEEAKQLWTNMAKSIGNVIDKMSDTRNTFLKSVLWEPWKLAEEHVNKAGISTEKFKKALLKTAKVTYKASKYEQAFSKALKDGKITKEVVIETLKSFTTTTKTVNKNTEDLTAKLKKFQKIVDQVWRGDFGNGQKRVEALTKAGYDYNEVQGLVNKCVDGYRLKISDLSDEQLKNIGYTDKQIEKIRELGKEAETSGTDFNKLIEDLSRPSGRELILDSINNLLKEFSKLTKAAGEAIDEVFGDNDTSGGFYNFIKQLHELTKNFKVTEEQAKAFKTIIEGVLSGVELTWTITGLGIKSVLKLISAVLSLFGTDLLQVTAYVADLITKFNEWAQKNTVWWGYINNLAKIIYALVDGIYSCIKAFLGLDIVNDTITRVWKAIAKFFGVFDFKDVGNNVENMVEIITRFFDNLEEKIKNLDNICKNPFELGKNIVEGLEGGIASGAAKVIEGIATLANKLIETFCEILGIASPSKVFFIIGGFIVAGLIYGIADSASLLGSSVKSLIGSIFNLIADVIKNGIPYIVELVKSLGGSLLDAVKDKQIDFGSIFVVASMATVAFLLFKIMKILDKFTAVTSPFKAFAGMLDGVTSLLGEFQKNVKAKRIAMYAESLKSVAIALAIMAGTFVLLSKIDLKKTWPALVVMGGFVLALIGVLAVASKLDPTAPIKLAVFSVAFSLSLMLMTVAIKRLTSINFGKAMGAVLALTILIGAMTVMLIAFGHFVKGKSAQNINKAGVLIVKISLALGAIALVLKLISTLSASDLEKGFLVLAGVELLFISIVAISKISGRSADKAGIMIAKMGRAILMIALAMKLIATMSWQDIAKGLIVVAGLELLFVGIIAVFHLLSVNKDSVMKGGSLFVAMSFSIGMMALAMKLLATISMGDIQKGIWAIRKITEMFAAFIILSNFVGANAGKAGKAFIGMAAGIAILAGTMLIFKSISNSDIARGMTIIAGFEAMFAGIIYVTKFAGADADKAGKMLIKMSAAIMILVGAIALLSLIKPEKVKMATAAIDSIIICLGALLVAFSFANAATAKAGLGDSTKLILLMTGAVAALAGIVALLAKMKPENVLASATSLCLLLGTLTTATILLSKLKGAVSPAQVASIALLGLIFVELAAILWIMKKLDVTPTIETASALVILLGGLVVFCYAASGLAPLVPAAAAGILGFAGLVAELTALLAALGFIYKDPTVKMLVEEGGELLKALGIALGKGIAGLIEGASTSLPAIGKYLSDFWENASAFLEGISTLDPNIVKNIKDLAGAIKTLTDAGLNELRMANANGASSLVMFANDLKPFGKAIKEFSEEVGEINDIDGVNQAVDVAKRLVELADIIPNSGGLAGIFAGNNDIDDFGTRLSAFGSSLYAFSESVRGMEDNEGSLDAAVKTAKGLAKLAETLPNMGGVWSGLVGEIDLSEFGSQLEKLGPSLASFANSIADSGFDESKVGTIKAAADAIKFMAKAGSEIDGQAEWSKNLFGDNSLGLFTGQLPLVGLSLKSFASNLGTFDETTTETIRCAVEAIKVMAEAGTNIDGQAEWSKNLFGDNSLAAFASTLPNIGIALSGFATNLGTFDETTIETIRCAVEAIKAMAKAGSEIDGQAEWSKNLFGDNSISSFTESFPSVGTALADFATNLGTFDESKVDTVKCAIDAITKMAKAGSNIDGQADWSKKIFGDNGIGSLATDLPDMGTALSGFAKNLGKFDEDKIKTINCAIKAVKAIAKLADSDLENANLNLPSFGDNLPDFSKGLKDFCSGMPETDKLETAIKNIKKVVSMVNEIANSKVKTVANFTKSLGDMGKSGVSAFVNAFSSNVSKSDAKKAAAALMDAAVEGAESRKESFKTKAEEIAKAGKTAIRELYDAFKNAGIYLVKGFANGIEEETWRAEAKSRAMAKAAKEAAEDELDENSPSKEFYRIAEFAGLGFVNGLDAYADKAYNKSAEMASSAKKGLKDAVSRIKDFISDGIDTNPTITPVLDLSSVSSGMKTMNGMLDMGSTIGVSANVSAVNSMMNSRIQNGETHQIINAINKLRSDLGNIGGDTYTINGVTYDDGSNITDAVKTLVRAAKVERRV